MAINLFLFGSNGHLGSKIYHVLNNAPFNVYRVSHYDFEYFISNFKSIISSSERAIIINCAGIVGNNNIQKCGIESLFNANSFIPFRLARLIQNTQSFLVQLSSNSVFDSSPLNIRAYSSPTSSHSPYGLSKILAENYIFSTLQPSQYLVLRTPQQYSDHFSTPRNFLSSFYYNYLNSKPNIIRRQERFSCASTLEIALYLRDSLLYGRTGVHHCASPYHSLGLPLQKYIKQF